MSRGRKNHGVRRAVWANFRRRQLRRRKRFHGSHKKHWKFAGVHGAYQDYKRSHWIGQHSGHLRPNKHYEKAPRHWPVFNPLIGSIPKFWKHPGKNPRTVFNILHPRPPHYPRHVIIGGQHRTLLYTGRKVGRKKGVDFKISAAWRWFFGTKHWHARIPSYQIGWPVWDPLGRLPKQAIFGHNI